MSINNLTDFITNCDVSDITTELNRYLFHIVLMHIVTYMLDNKDPLFGPNLFKIMFATVISVTVYHLVFKRFVTTKLKQIQSTCKKGDKDIININNNQK